MSTRKETDKNTHEGGKIVSYATALLIAAIFVFALSYFAIPSLLSVSYSEGVTASSTPSGAIKIPPLDKVAYDEKLLALAHVATSSPWYYAYLAGTTTITLPGATTTTKVAKQSWPVWTAAYPEDSRALLPFNRIVSYYGNFYSKNMGVLGQYPEDVMLQKLASTTDQWRKADPTTPVIPAIHYIAIVAQGSAGADGKYRAVMPDDQIDHAIDLANKINGITFLDLQIGLSDVETELPKFEKYLSMDKVEVGLDPEFAMKTSGYAPGKYIGTLDAKDINFAINYLSDIVKKNNLPPKILMIHRFTMAMVTNYQDIKPTPQVQFVMDMDGWGEPARKINTYQLAVEGEPVQFTGFKLFYKNDLLPPSTGMMTPAQVLSLKPAPIYIQYQ
ncbi:MAG TPA: hypothetical protein VN701_01690 [Candidatus Paceibacterota bacterium]|nr:hypothetical protein [Candidatus Paceibacterota bacterium]